MVHSSCGGDPIAFRASEWFIGRKLKADTRLKYLIEHSDSSRFRKGSLLIYAEVDCQAGDIFPGDACVITDGDSLEVVACQSTTDTHASFAPISGNGATMTVPFNARYVHTRPGAPYMIDDGERLQLMRCKGANDTMASFEPFSGKGVARMIPLDTSRVASPTRMVGIVIATFCAELSPRLADREQDGHGLRPL